MAKTLVLEGCPYGEITIPAYFTNTLRGGAIGAGGVIVTDMLLAKFFPRISPNIRALIEGACIFGCAYALRNRYPEIATGLALGGGAIVIYRLIASLMGRLVGVSLGELGELEEEEYESLGQEVPEEEVEVVETESPLGTIVAEPTEEEVEVI